MPTNPEHVNHGANIQTNEIAPYGHHQDFHQDHVLQVPLYLRKTRQAVSDGSN